MVVADCLSPTWWQGICSHRSDVAANGRAHNVIKHACHAAPAEAAEATASAVAVATSSDNDSNSNSSSCWDDISALYSPREQWGHYPLVPPAWNDIWHRNASYVRLADYPHASNPPVYPCRRHTAPGLQGQWNTAQPWRGQLVVSYQTWASVQRTFAVPLHNACHSSLQ